MADQTIGTRISTEVADGTLNLTSAPTIPAIPTPGTDLSSVAKAVAVMKQIMDVREGRSGSVLDKLLTVRDLVTNGIIGLNLGNGVISGSGGGVISGGSTTIVDPGTSPGYTDPRPILSTPPTPTALTVFGAFKNIVLTWQLLDYQNHSYVEIWRNTVNVLGSATLIGNSTANIYDDASGTLGVTYYYWVRAVGYDAAGSTITGAYNAVSGVSGGLLKIGNTDLGPLVVEAANLASMDLSNLVTNSTAGPGQGTSGYLALDGTVAVVNNTTVFTYWAGGYAFAMTGRDMFFGQVFSVKPGDEFTFSGQMIASGGGVPAHDIRIGFNDYDAAGNSLGGYIPVYSDNVASGLGGLQTFKDLSFTVPAGRYGLRIWISINQGTGGSDVFYFNNLEVRRKPTKLAVNTIVAGDGAIANLAITNGLIANAAIDDAKIANLSAAKVTFGVMSGDRIDVGTMQANRLIANSITAGQIAANTITAGQIAAHAITANEIAANTITAGQMNVTNLSTISANMGSITAGTLTLNTTGYVMGGQTDYNTGTGFFLGYSGAAYKFSIGSPTGPHMNWDGTNLMLNQATFDSFTASLSAGDIVLGDNTTTFGSFPYGYQNYGSRTATPSGGKAPYSYVWIVSAGVGSDVQISGGTSTSATVSIKGFGDGTVNVARVLGFIQDANGRMTMVNFAVHVTHQSSGSGTTVGGGGDAP